MIVFTKIRYTNFLACGNYWNEIDLSKNDLTVIIGKNGSGKSTITEALCYGLFGKAFRKITKNQIVNSVTKKNCLVEVEFISGSDSYKIRRGIKPDVFEIFKNSVLIPQDSRIDLYQDYLEKYILHCNHKSFCQVVILGSASYIPFLELPAKQRREVVENILDLEIFSIMNINMKKQAIETTEKLSELNSERTILVEQIKIYNENEKKLKEDKQKLISSYEENINANQEQINKIALSSGDMKEIKNKIAEHDEKISEVNDKIYKANNKLGEIATAINKLNQEIEFYKSNDNCPVCKQLLEQTFKTDTIEHKTLLVESLIDSRDKKKNNLDNVSLNFRELKKQKEELVIEYNRVLEKTSLVKVKEAEIVSWKDIINSLSQETEHSSGNFDEINTKLLEVSRKIDDISKIRESESFILKMLKDDGIKAQIIKQYIDLINLLVNQYLQDMNFLCQFILDEEFNETIKSRYRDDFSFSSFSEGEKLRITLAILFTWREIAKRRNSISTNILFFDEVLSGSLDTDGVEDFIKIIKSMNKGENVFLITHDKETISMSENIIEFQKVKGFSHIVASNE